MTDQTTFRLSSPSDVLAAVPFLLGFHPEDSVVMVTTGSARAFHARADLPSTAEEAAELGATLAAALRRNPARGVVLVLYTDDACVAEAVLDPVRDELEDAGARVLEALRADGHRWFSLTCAEACCPEEGVPYDVGSHPLTAQAVLEGRVALRSRREVEDSLIGTDVDDLEAVADAARKAARRFVAVARDPIGRPTPAAARSHLVQEGHWVRARVRRFLDDRAPLDVGDAARLLVAMLSIEVRDVAWAELRPANTGAHIDLWRQLTRRSPEELRAAPAALLAFSAWLGGDGALAWCAVERCQQADPGYSLAGLVSQALAGAVPPSTWEPVRPEHLTLFAG